MIQNTAKIAYISFDTLPSHKGAAVHIESFVRALAQQYGTVELVTVAAIAPKTPAKTVNWSGVNHTVLPAMGKTLIDRVMCFRRHLHMWLQEQCFDVIQIRSIFEGFVVAKVQQQRQHNSLQPLYQQLIFEVNGLPSIELKYRYPKVANDWELMHKLRLQEHICLRAADTIVTPSAITKQYLKEYLKEHLQEYLKEYLKEYLSEPLKTHGQDLLRQGIRRNIQVIPNGVDLSVMTYQPPRETIKTLNMLYFGTLSAWQGVGLATEALALYRRDFDARLTIIGPTRGKQVAQLKKLANKLKVTASMQILEARPQAELVQFMHQADIILAPLKPNDRNLVQGCCPLKVLEGMASGTPVITSDLPVVTQLGESEHHFLAVQPGSAKAIKDGLLRLREDAPLRLRLSQTGRSHIENHYTWQHAHHHLQQIYHQHFSQEL
ncbi:MAG: glycosyltransferase family 4 protein [Phormidesmis sp. RL_2_1]|nr:glycosyltransferase family 4 protein [Phormidesmis sp. RL_2_1]